MEIRQRIGDGDISAFIDFIDNLLKIIDKLTEEFDKLILLIGLFIEIEGSSKSIGFRIIKSRGNLVFLFN